MSIGRKDEFKFLVPETVQTSAMDCGPSSLKAILEGLGISVNLGRLREACQTDVDGTSIDTLEDILVQIGVDAQQILIPTDHLLVDGSNALPALLVVRLPDGNTHFLVAWRRLGPLVQLMDPAVGRRWVPCKKLLNDCYQIEMPVPAVDWRDWAGGSEFLGPLNQRLRELGLPNKRTQILVSTATNDESWLGLASLDAATRLTATLRRSGAIKREGAESTLTALMALIDRTGTGAIPNKFWFVRPDQHDEDQLTMRGAVLISVRGLAEADKATSKQDVLPEDLSTALSEPPSRPIAELFGFLKKDGLSSPIMLAFGTAVAAGAVIAEALLYRSLLTRSALIDGSNHQLMLFGGTLMLLVLLLMLEIPLTKLALQIGRKLECRIRTAVLETIPRLGDRYFSSRLVSDLAERSHSIFQVRETSITSYQLLSTALRMVFVAIGLCWLDFRATPLILTLTAVLIVTPILALPVVTERELRTRTHLGALSRYYLDSFLGLFTIRAHGAEDNVKTGHQSRLTLWIDANQSFLRTTIAAETATGILSTGLILWLVFDHYQRNGETATILLFVYWVLLLPSIGQQFAALSLQLPSQRNIVLRQLEPLSAPKEKNAQRRDAAPANQAAAKIDIENGTVVTGGHTVLKDINLSLEPGEHIAVIGPSGAGKSSFAGILLGWNKLSTGRMLIDNQVVDADSLQRLRATTVWLDPSVQLWNKTLLSNMQYGGSSTTLLPADEVMDLSDLGKVVDRLPDGLQTMIGEGGGLLSGGEGQRVRFARTLSRRDARLVVFDEPFRGLPRDDRKNLLRDARKHWRSATFICITHDLDELSEFSRVIVIQDGTIVQDGSPESLMDADDSRLRELFDQGHAKTADRYGVEWRNLSIVNGIVSESHRS